MPNNEPCIGDAEASDAQMKDCVGAIPEDRNPFVQGVDGIPVCRLLRRSLSPPNGESVKIREHYC